MFITPEHRSTSSMAHVGLMSFVFIVFLMTMFTLVIGWRWYFGMVSHRQELARLSVMADDSISQRAASQAARIKASTRAAVTLPEPTLVIPEASNSPKSTVKLAELARDSNTEIFPDPMPLSDDVAPDRLKAATDVQNQFWQAATWKEKSAFVVDPDRVGPLMREYYETQKNEDPVAGNAIHQAHFKLNNTEVLLYSYNSARPGGALDMALIAAPDGRFLIDWESYVGASDMAWSEFKRARTVQPVLFRVFANQDDYYNYEFSDDKTHMCFHLASPDGFYFVKGYCERGSSIASTLENLFGSGAQKMPLTLRLEFPTNALSDHCVKIVGVVANRWLLVR